MAPTTTRARRRTPSAAVVLLAALAFLQGCAFYSFSGASIPDHLNSVAIPLAEDRARGGPPALDQALTEALISRFADQTRLALTPDESDADAVVQATIERYSVAPAAVTTGNLAALNRVQISVRVLVSDNVRNAPLLDRAFQASEDFDPAEGLSGEADAAQRAIAQIARDAFTAATSGW